MWSIIAKGLLALVAHVDDVEGLVSAVETEVNSIATGEGGPQKVAKAAAALSAVSTSIGKLAVDAATVTS